MRTRPLSLPDCSVRPLERAGPILPLPVLVLTPLRRLCLRLAGFARLLVKALPAHVLEEAGANHPSAELLQRPVQAIVFTNLNLDQAITPSGAEKKRRPREGSGSL